jgi:hypothetical protein
VGLKGEDRRGRAIVALPSLPALLFRPRLAPHSQVVEPFDPGVHSPRKGLPGPHPGGAPRAVWRWDSGRITRQQFDAVPWSLVGDQCIHCLYARRYKLLGGRLYEQEDLLVHLRPLPFEFGRKLWDELSE